MRITKTGLPWGAARAAALTLALTLAAACSSPTSIIPDRRPDYRQARVMEPLELPPDLSASTLDDTLTVPDINPTGTARLSDYSRERAGGVRVDNARQPVLPAVAGVEVMRDGARRWLLVQAEAEALWPRLQDFWINQGLRLESQDPRIGIMETEWAENRADIPQGAIRSFLSRAIEFAYSAPTRDRFRTRLQPTPGGTEVFITHYGMEEVTQGQDGERVLWQSRPSDPELEAEMLNRLVVFLGGAGSPAEAMARLESASAGAGTDRVRRSEGPGGAPGLIVDEAFDRAWRLVGLALDSSPFRVEGQDPATGTYLVRHDGAGKAGGEKGLLSSLAFWRDDEPAPGLYRVRLAAQGARTLVAVYDGEGAPARGEPGQEIRDTLLSVLQ